MPSCGRGSCLPLLALVLVLFYCSVGSADAQRRARRSSPWRTLNGDAPVVVAKGGHSGLFPGYSQIAYGAAMQASLPGTLLWCDVQLTKDGLGICLPDVRMDNGTDIDEVFSNKGRSSYVVNGVPMTGHFPLDFDSAKLSQVSLTQGVYSRTQIFDRLFPINSVKDVLALPGQPSLWLNFQYNMFYSQHNLSMRSYLLSLARTSVINFVSSPEVSFLRGLAARFSRSKTQLVFRFLEADATEPSTNQTYDSLLMNLTFIKTFASGILVPRNYIWPVNASLYLQQPNTSVVLNAHKAGLKVFAADFANDNILAYDYNYNPISEYLHFVDNNDFSVDGILTDSPVTASEAIGCFSHVNMTGPKTGIPMVISHHGASGVYPGCTDLAYQQAVDDGADYIDCPVQVTKDLVLICMNDVNLFKGTTVAKSPYTTRSSVIPELQSEQGVFTFNLTWKEIQQNLKPQIETPLLKYEVVRNPLKINDGAFMTLTNFLTFAKDKSLSGILISIENAAFLAESLGFSVTDEVLKALSDSGYDNDTSHKVIIQSTNSSVLMKMKQLSRYEMMYKVDEYIRDAISSSIKDISEFAHSVAIMKQSVYPESDAFIVDKTDLVTKFQKANISVYAYLFMNEYLSQVWDFFSDPIAEINTYVTDAGINGVITDYPGTAAAYRRNTCLGKNRPSYMLPVQPAGLKQLLESIPSAGLPPALAPLPSLTDSDVVEPPLAAAVNRTGPTGGAGAPTPQPPNGQPSTSAPVVLCFLVMFVVSCLLV